MPAGFGTVAKHDRTHHSLKSPACSYANEILSLLRRDQKNHSPPLVKYWEIIADNLSKAGWSWGCVSAVDCHGRTIWIADAHRDDGRESQEISFLTLLSVIEILLLREVR